LITSIKELNDKNISSPTIRQEIPHKVENIEYHSTLESLSPSTLKKQLSQVNQILMLNYPEDMKRLFKNDDGTRGRFQGPDRRPCPLKYLYALKGELISKGVSAEKIECLEKLKDYNPELNVCVCSLVGCCKFSKTSCDYCNNVISALNSIHCERLSEIWKMQRE